MTPLMEMIGAEVEAAFLKNNIDTAYAGISVSKRPDLCDYQCNGAMAAAKKLKKAPIEIAEAIANDLKESWLFCEVFAAKPGFINMKLSGEMLRDYASAMAVEKDFGYPKLKKRTIIIDYGGANVAKPLHVGHLRPAIIGESIKRILRFAGNEVIGDVHLGDWGLQMGLIVAELFDREPDLVYFDEEYTGEYPSDAPFTISELEEIYPSASARSKEDSEFYERALLATKEMQEGRRGYQALLGHILSVSIRDLKRNYDRLNVSFDLWKGEKDAAPYIPEMVEKMKADGYAHISEGALVVDVSEPDDTKEIPPCMILKSDGAALYDTTDLATLVWREEDYHPDAILYVVDKRQSMHFVQVFRCARKTGIVPKDTELTFLGNGTMNGRDGKPFKTREGGVMRLEALIDDINSTMLEKIMANGTMSCAKARETAETVGLAALKYGDLSNMLTKDYVFDIDRFTSSEGNTGPYILYTIVRIKSILRKHTETFGDTDKKQFNIWHNESERVLMLELCRFSAAIDAAAGEYAPHKLCAYIYELCNAFNHFYHETKILATEDQSEREGYIALLELLCNVLLCAIDLLGFSAPEKM